MRSRGVLFALSAASRKGLALTWTALLVSTLLLQYAAFAAPSAALAVHSDGVFELDGDATAGAAAGDDWSNLANADASVLIADGIPERSFTTGGSKDDLDTTSWLHTLTAVPDKDDLQHAFAALYGHAIYFGADRFANNGDSAVGFWFFKNGIALTAGGFTPAHTVGDLFVVSHFVNGGSAAEIELYEWVGSGGSNGSLDLVATGQGCTAAPAADKACAVVNTADTAAPWSFTPKSGTADVFPAGSFFEGGLDLVQVYGSADAVPCFSGFLVETRSSQEIGAQLKDFVAGSFNTCKPPVITTASSVSTADFGSSVTDTATLTGTDGPVAGTVTFYVCGPTATAPNCSTGGTKVGAAVTIAGGAATSAAYQVGVTAAAAGTYCWRAEYTPADGSPYLAGSHTNITTECFTVAPATISITKTANPAGPVSAGDAIGFDITVENSGTQTTLGVSVSDTLPAGITWTADAPTGATTGLNCSITSGVLTCTKPSLAAGASFTVHVHGMTDAADCGLVENTASVATSNDGTDSDGADVTVLCPDIHVLKTADNTPINAGDTASYTITVSNDGQGLARDVTLTDTLPAGVSWSDDSVDCSITAGVLSCDFGDLAAGASVQVTVSGTTDAADCGDVYNLAAAEASNESAADATDNSDDATIGVRCADISITKTANPVGPVNAGDQVGFTVTVTNSGDGTAYDVAATDELPAGLTWTIESGAAGWAIDASVLTYTAAELAAGASVTVHIVADTTAENCGLVENTATVVTGNDGSDSASANVTVHCPDVTVTKTAVASPVNAGDPIAFDITVTNLGPGVAYGVTLADTLPAGISWTDDSLLCTITAGILACNFGDLAANGSFTVRVAGTADAADCGLVPNTATVAASNEPADATANNTSTANVTVNCPDVTVTKTAVASPVNAGDPIAFDITVTNLGPGAAYDVTLADTLPAGISWTDNRADCSIADGTLTCEFGDLAVDASVTVRVSGTTDAADCGLVPNTATVAASNEPAGATGNNSDRDSVTVRCPDIHVQKTADNSPISAGDEASFTITVTNDGVGSAYDVTLTDTLPAGVAWTDDSAACDIAGGVLTCDFGTIAPNASRTVTVSGDTDAADCGTLPNTASAVASNESAADATDNSDSAEIVVDCPAILITKTAVDGQVNATDQVAFDIVVTNTGDGNAYGVTVADTLPTDSGLGWSIDLANSDAGWNISAGVLAYGPATLASGASVSVRIVSGTTAATCGTIDNSATVTYRGGSDSDDDSIAVLCPDVVLTKTADNSPILAGQTASYTISVWNEGPGTAYDVVVTDTLPAGVTWSEDSEACSIVGGVLTCDLGDMIDNASVDIHVSGDTTVENCGSLPNTASVEASNEPDAATENNSDGDTVTVQCASIGLVKTAGDAPDGETLLLDLGGGDVIFTYVITNTGTAALEHVALVDDNATPGTTSDDINIECPATTLAAGASMTCHLTLPISGPGLIRTNIATVTANPVLDPEAEVSDTDDAVVQVPEPEVTPTPTPTRTPRITMPPTSTLGHDASGTDGNGLLLALLAIAGCMLAVGFIAPTPARSRRRNPRS